jgi:hypothetical protein
MAIELKKAPHVGQSLRAHVKAKRIYQAPWARLQGVNASTVNSYFKKPTMQLSTLFTICQVLKYNFIRDIADELPPDFPSKKPEALQVRICELEKENERLRIEIEVLKEVARGK